MYCRNKEEFDSFISNECVEQLAFWFHFMSVSLKLFEMYQMNKNPDWWSQQFLHCAISVQMKNEIQLFFNLLLKTLWINVFSYRNKWIKWHAKVDELRQHCKMLSFSQYVYYTAAPNLDKTSVSGRVIHSRRWFLNCLFFDENSSRSHGFILMFLKLRGKI